MSEEKTVEKTEKTVEHEPAAPAPDKTVEKTEKVTEHTPGREPAPGTAKEDTKTF
jgi:hypothetical protein